MGGSLTYKFLFHDTISNQDHYRVKLQLFRDCNNAALSGSYELGVYEHSAANPQILYNTFTLGRDSLQRVNPPSQGDSCSFTTSVCVEEGDYHADIALGSSTEGYYLLTEMNARNAAIVNLFNTQMPPASSLGQTYFALIPPSAITNSSPTFADIPVPFICTSDTISIVNLATDVDGDSLSYSFVVPYNSYATGAAPPSPATINVPPPSVPYNTPTYTFALPFGAGGYAYIDPISGLTRYYIPNIGNYVVCVQIDEYRNGVLIASTRRDLQLIAITCPFNPTPVLSNAGGSGTTIYSITEGENLCFPITVTDPNGDSIYVHGAGNLFDSTIVNPHATLADVAGQPTVSSQFCWTTGCGQGRTTPYQFNVSARDNGCPGKVANFTYSIYVRPFTGPIAIYGPDSVCNKQQAVAYNVVNAPGNSYHWSVTNGTQVTGDTSNAITINWGNAATGSISVYAVSPHGCTRDTISKTVVLKALPVPNAGLDTGFCSGQTIGIGSGTIPGYTYSWNPTAGLTPGSTVANPNVTLLNATTNPVTYNYILTATLNGCPANDTAQVTVRPLPISPAINDRFACSGDTVYLGGTAGTGYTYAWSSIAGLNSSSVSNPYTVVSNASAVDDTLLFYLTSSLGNCNTNDTVKIIVHPLPVVTATANPDSVCAGDTSVLHGFGGSTYSWATSLTPGVSIGTGSTINVIPAATTTYIVTGTAVNSCVNKNTVTVIESPLPPVNGTASPDSVCKGSSSTISVSGGVNYWWSTLQLPNDTISTASSFIITPDSAITYIVTGVSGFGCVNKDTVAIALNPAPLADSIFGNQSLCPGVTGVGYIALASTSTSTYQWIIQSGTIASGQNTDTVFANWDTTSGPGSISVIETTNKGCKSDTIKLPVNINVILTPAAPFGITPVCEENADSSVYSTFNTPGSVYTWGVLNGHLISANGTNVITINWDSTGTNSGIIWYQENSTTTDTSCFGISDTLYITIHARPLTSAISGTFVLCAFDTGNVYLVNPSAGSTYHWTSIGGTITGVDTINSIHVNWGLAGTDTITVIETSVFGCVGRPVDTTIIVHPLPIADAGLPVSVCTGDSVTLNATGGVSYIWTPSTGLSSTIIHNPFAFPASTTPYTVQVTDANNCKNKDSVVVTVNSLPNADAGVNTNVCIGSSVGLTATGGTQYSWSPSIGLSNPAISNPAASPLTDQMYYVDVQDANNCHKIDSVLVTVLPLPTVFAGNDSIICGGSHIQLQASGGIYYLWSPAAGLSNIHIANPVATPADSTTYTVTVTDIHNCHNTDNIFVDINPMPKSLFDVVYQPGCSGLTAKLVNLSTDDSSYVWLFGDGNSETGSYLSPFDTTTHLYPYGNTGTISLITINSFCRDTLSVAKPDIGIGNALDSLPNVFTPNGDGFNDCYQITPNGGLNDCATIRIFNRWGETVFEGDTNHHCWDGKNKGGSECAEGVYFFVVKVGNAAKNGSVQLIRK